ncbi:MAG: hypothetical protein RLZZ86_272 [Cyanobacteriota bacterium]|jgi:hypothetical protein
MIYIYKYAPWIVYLLGKRQFQKYIIIQKWSNVIGLQSAILLYEKIETDKQIRYEN